MKKYRITVEGITYLVEVEEVERQDRATQAQPLPASPAPPASAPNPSQNQIGGGDVTAPMPGTVLNILVAPGDEVKAGQPVLILEAMKMENKITASASGAVGVVKVSQGQSIEAGQLLLTIT